MYSRLLCLSAWTKIMPSRKRRNNTNSGMDEWRERIESWLINRRVDSCSTLKWKRGTWSGLCLWRLKLMENDEVRYYRPYQLPNEQTQSIVKREIINQALVRSTLPSVSTEDWRRNNPEKIFVANFWTCPALRNAPNREMCEWNANSLAILCTVQIK